MVTFQFLGRNSGRSDADVKDDVVSEIAVSIPRSEFWSFGQRHIAERATAALCFNSSVGILVVRTFVGDWGSTKGIAVSIPLSEFWSFGRVLEHGAASHARGFNSSVGILVVRTSRTLAL